MNEKIDNIGFFDKTTGELLEDGKEIFESIQKEERMSKIKKLMWMFENSPNEMTFEQVRELRNLYNKQGKDDVVLKYSDGFYMVAKNTENNLRTLSLDTCGFLHILGFNINKSGVAIYKNNRNITSFEELRVFTGVSETVWRRVKKEIDSLNIIRKVVFEDKMCLILNPMYMGIAYEVTELKFYCFNSFFKEGLSPIDYLYLCKQWEIFL